MSETKELSLPSTRVTLTVEHTHHCGQVIQEVTTLREGDYSLTTFYDPPFSLSLDAVHLDIDRNAFAQALEDAQRRKMLLDLHGTVEGIAIMGCAFVEGKGLRCLTCGANMLFPEEPLTQTPFPTFSQWDASKEAEAEAVGDRRSQS